MSGGARVLASALHVRHSDPATRMRAVNALVLTYAMVVVGTLAAIPISLIPSGVNVAVVVLVTDLVFLGVALLLRSGRVELGLAIFFTAFLGSFAVSQAVIEDSRLTAVYCIAPVIVASVTLRRRGVAIVTVVAAAIAFGGLWLYPTVDPPISRTEIIVAAAVLMAVSVATGLLGMWGQRRETERADDAAARATELAASLRLANADLERRVDERTEELQSALSQQERLVSELAELTMRDPLTGLHNRRHAEHELPRMSATAQRYEQPLAMALLDLDHFKLVNDRYSYSMGDEVLLRFTAILRENARASDVVVRYGGEEFLLVMPQTTLEQALVLCERLRAAVAAYPWHEVDARLAQTVSIGVADNAHRDLRAATAAMDAALHEAKRSGRNRVVAAPEAIEAVASEG
ncbi:MAG: GGDEF domain-containing protein [Candidatus Nanopelagicales bacterium]